MSAFCHCGSITKYVENGNTMYTICPRCGTEKALEPKDTMIYSMPHTSSSTSFVKPMMSAPFSPVDKRIESPCPKCKRPIRTLLLLGIKKTPVLTCVCGTTEENKI